MDRLADVLESGQYQLFFPNAYLFSMFSSGTFVHGGSKRVQRALQDPSTHSSRKLGLDEIWVEIV